MKRERTQDYDVFRLADSISVVERKSGAAVVSFAIPSDEARLAMIKLLSDPVKSNAAHADEAAPATDDGAEKATTEKSKTSKNKSKKGAS